MHWSFTTGGHFDLRLVICAAAFMIDLVFGILRAVRWTGKGFGYWIMSLLGVLAIACVFAAVGT
jgi:hypothetical protein